MGEPNSVHELPVMTGLTVKMAGLVRHAAEIDKIHTSTCHKPACTYRYIKRTEERASEREGERKRIRARRRHTIKSCEGRTLGCGNIFEAKGIRGRGEGNKAVVEQATRVVDTRNSPCVCVCICLSEKGRKRVCQVNTTPWECILSIIAVSNLSYTEKSELEPNERRTEFSFSLSLSCSFYIREESDCRSLSSLFYKYTLESKDSTISS